MIALDEDALFCDYAETYHIIDFYTLPVDVAARLAVGLRSNSRIKTKMMGIDESFDLFLQAQALDTMRMLLWTKTKDAVKGRNKPKSIAEGFFHKEKETASYSTIDDFRAARERILKAKKKTVKSA